MICIVASFAMDNNDYGVAEINQYICQVRDHEADKLRYTSSNMIPVGSLIKRQPLSLMGLQ